MPRKQLAYRSTPTNPNVPVDQPAATATAIEDLDDFLDEIDDLLTQEEEFAVHYRARPGE